MDYQPNLPTHNDNVSHEHPVREFMTLLLGLAAILIAVYLLLGLLVDYSIEHISPEDEVSLFANFGNDYFADQAIEDEHQLSTLVDSLAACANLSIPINFTVVEDPTPNAMALPGGRIYLFSGLLNYVETQNGLAFVLAHELGHVVNRDHLRGLGRGIVLTALASVVAGPSSGLSQFITPLLVNTTFAQHSQSRESAADETALAILNCHYGHTAGATELFNALAAEEEQSPSFVHWFSSHPELRGRIATLQRLINQAGYHAGETTAL